MSDAVLVLADGTYFEGISIGKDGVSVGEVVFNTSMTGYQEILTDPSYAKQIITLTYPHIGNTGINQEDEESRQVFANGLIIRSLSQIVSNFRAEDNLANYLKKKGIVAISEIDTRQLTRLIRIHGSQAGCIMSGKSINVKQGIQLAKSFGTMSGKDLASVVSCQKPYQFDEERWELKKGLMQPPVTSHKVVVYDFGVKKNILRLLVSRGCNVMVVPAKTTAEEALAYNPDGIFLSNGPGDPEVCDYAIKAIQSFLERNIPLFGICLGHQLLALSLGGKTKKMKFGHHGANHPVIDLRSGRVAITSQNHGFEVDINSLPKNVLITHVSLFDGSLQGIELEDKPAFSFQGHPEASPGPQDLENLFDKFIKLMQNHQC